MSVSAPPSEISARLRTLQSMLLDVAREFPDAVFASSLGAEDMVLTHVLFSSRIPIDVITLDTGRLHAETLALLDRIHATYGHRLRVMRPCDEVVQAHVLAYGQFAFYESVALRKACCGIRKVQPLAEALAGRAAWITGQRREQGASRESLSLRESDPVFDMIKFNPLADWSWEDVWSEIDAHHIPYNPLHDRGYPSVGCEPCTRAVREGEDIRAGRWWWESAVTKECGLHAGNGTVSVILRPARGPF